MLFFSVCVSVSCVCWFLGRPEEGCSYNWPLLTEVLAASTQPPPHHTSWIIFSSACYIVPLFWQLWRFYFGKFYIVLKKEANTFIHSHFNYLKNFPPIYPFISHLKTSVSAIGVGKAGSWWLIEGQTLVLLCLFTPSLLVNADARLTHN